MTSREDMEAAIRAAVRKLGPDASDEEIDRETKLQVAIHRAGTVAARMPPPPRPAPPDPAAMAMIAQAAAARREQENRRMEQAARERRREIANAEQERMAAAARARSADAEMDRAVLQAMGNLGPGASEAAIQAETVAVLKHAEARREAEAENRARTRAWRESDPFGHEAHMAAQAMAHRAAFVATKLRTEW